MDKFVKMLKPSMVGVVSTFALVGNALAINKPQNVPSTFVNMGASIGTIFNVVILIASIAFVVLFLVGGIQYLTASGNEEQSGKARKLLLDAIIGLIIVLAAWGLGGWIITQFTGGQINLDTIPSN